MNVIRGTKYFIIKKEKKMKNKYKKLLKSGVINKDAKLGDLKSLLRQVGGQHYQDFVIQPAEFIKQKQVAFC
jgi:5-formaminoimidazole-4-carboxamide-1-beta-D-ribofuranosyl 5'-monophosphate synthetase